MKISLCHLQQGCKWLMVYQFGMMFYHSSVSFSNVRFHLLVFLTSPYIWSTWWIWQKKSVARRMNSRESLHVLNKKSRKTGTCCSIKKACNMHAMGSIMSLSNWRVNGSIEAKSKCKLIRGSNKRGRNNGHHQCFSQIWCNVELKLLKEKV